LDVALRLLKMETV